MSALDTLRAATPTRKSVTMCLDGALQAEWDAAVDAVNEAAKADASEGSLAGAMPATEAAFEHLDELADRVSADEVTFLFAAERLSWGEYLRMQAEHKPREGNLLDRLKGFNVETFYPVLVRATCASVSSAGGDEETVPDDVWDTLLGDGEKPGSLNLKQVNNLVAGAEFVMNGETAVPPSARSLLKSRDFGASLALPSPGTSPPSGSAVGAHLRHPSPSHQPGQPPRRHLRDHHGGGGVGRDDPGPGARAGRREPLPRLRWSRLPVSGPSAGRTTGVPVTRSAATRRPPGCSGRSTSPRRPTRVCKR